MANSNGNTVDTFTPAPGYFLVEDLDSKTPDDTTTRQGKVLTIGNSYTNDFGTKLDKPPIEDGDLVAYKWEFNNDCLEIKDDFGLVTKYSIVHFGKYRGTL